MSTGFVSITAYQLKDGPRTNLQEVRDCIRDQVLARGYARLRDGVYISKAAISQSESKGLTFISHHQIEITVETFLIDGKLIPAVVPWCSRVWIAQADPDNIYLIAEIQKCYESHEEEVTIGQVPWPLGRRGGKGPLVNVRRGIVSSQSNGPEVRLKLNPQLIAHFELGFDFHPDSGDTTVLREVLSFNAPLLLQRQWNEVQYRYGRQVSARVGAADKFGLLKLPPKKILLIRSHLASASPFLANWVQTHLFDQGQQGRDYQAVREVLTSPHKFGALELQLCKPAIFLEDIYEGDQQQRWATKMAQISDTSHPVCICALESELLEAEMNTITSALKMHGVDPHFVNVTKQSHIRGSSGAYQAQVGIALRIAVAGGATPWEAYNLPGTDANTVFLGIDIGHNHHARVSTCGITLCDHGGKRLSAHSFQRFTGDETLGQKDIENCLHLLESSLAMAAVSHVILHRDGLVADHELECWLRAVEGQAYQISIIQIMKDTRLRFREKTVEGTWVKLDADRALLLSCGQAMISGAMPSPLVIRLRHSAAENQTLDATVAQIFGLCGMHWRTQRLRLPVTIHTAHMSAYTGKRGFAPRV